MRLSIIIPAFNEAQRLPRTLRSIAEHFSAPRSVVLTEVIVVDDGSSDGTADVAKAEAASLPIRVIRFPENRGKGAATRAGMLEATGEFCLMYDADGATPIAEIGRFAALHGDDPAPVMIGSRVMASERNIVKMTWYRQVIGRVYHMFCHALAPGIDDAACGFKLFERAVARDLFSRQTIDRFAFDVEILSLALRSGYRVWEIPVHWEAVPGSKVNLVTDTVQMAWSVLLLYVRRWFR